MSFFLHLSKQSLRFHYTITIHSLTINSSEPIYLICKRKNKHYQTKIGISDNGIIHWNEIWQFNSTIYKNKKTNCYDKKIFIFQIKNEKKSNKLNDLEVEIDISNFCNELQESEITKTF